jgi:hypothetical protein
MCGEDTAPQQAGRVMDQCSASTSIVMPPLTMGEPLSGTAFEVHAD